MTRTVTLTGEQASIAIVALEFYAKNVHRPSKGSDAAAVRREIAIARDLAMTIRIA